MKFNKHNMFHYKHLDIIFAKCFIVILLILFIYTELLTCLVFSFQNFHIFLGFIFYVLNIIYVKSLPQSYLWRTDWRNPSLCVWNAHLRRCCRRRAKSWLCAPWVNSRSCSSPPDCCSSAKILNDDKEKRSPQDGYASHTCRQLFHCTRPTNNSFLYYYLSLRRSTLYFLCLFCEKGSHPALESPIYGQGGCAGGWAQWHQHQTQTKQKQIGVM